MLRVVLGVGCGLTAFAIQARPAAATRGRRSARSEEVPPERPPQPPAPTDDTASLGAMLRSMADKMESFQQDVNRRLDDQQRAVTQAATAAATTAAEQALKRARTESFGAVSKDYGSELLNASRDMALEIQASDDRGENSGSFGSRSFDHRIMIISHVVS